MAYVIPNATEPMDILVEMSGQVPLLFNGILLMIFAVICIASWYAQDRKTGQANISQSMSIASFITCSLGIVLFLYSGILPLASLSLLFIIMISSVLWLLFQND